MLASTFRFPCGLTVPNRIVKASMTERLAGPDCRANAQLQATLSPKLAVIGMLLAERGFATRRRAFLRRNPVQRFQPLAPSRSAAA